MIFILTLILSLAVGPQDSKVHEIQFGSGGGFSGAITTYALTDEGRLYKVNVFNDERSFQGNIDLKKTRSIFSKIDEYDLKSLRISKPANTYRFIVLKNREGEHRITWSGNSENKNLNLFHTQLKALCKINE